MSTIEFARRLALLEGNVFADMDRAKTAAKRGGKKIIDLSLGSSDLPVSKHVIEAIERALHNPSTHGYLLHRGTEEYREAVSKWYSNRFGIPVDAETEVLPLIGSQEGTAHLPLALLNPGDFALLLDPGYPSHVGGVYLAGGQIYPMPLLEENHFLPRFPDIPTQVLEQSRMMVLSYPHNPTAAVAPLSFFEEALSFCEAHNIVLVHDFPYVDMFFTSEPPPSVFEADREKSRSIEFFSFSKSYNMGGFRVGFAIGNPELIRALAKIKATVDFNQYLGILEGAIEALEGPQDSIQETVNTFKIRRDRFIGALNKIGWQVPAPEATMYVWARLPLPWRDKSVEFCTRLVAETGVALSPGAGFGKCGEGYVRFALVHPPETLEEAVGKIADFLGHNSPN